MTGSISFDRVAGTTGSIPFDRVAGTYDRTRGGLGRGRRLAGLLDRLPLDRADPLVGLDRGRRLAGPLDRLPLDRADALVGVEL